MKTHIYLFAACFLICPFFSCQKENMVKEKELSLKAVALPYYTNIGCKYWGYISLSAINYNPNLYDESAFYFSGSVFKKPIKEVAVDGGTMRIGHISLQPGANSNVKNAYGNGVYSHKNGEQAKSLFGQMVDFELTGNKEEGIPPFYTHFYVPELLEATVKVNGNAQKYGNFKRGSTIEITWNPDINNHLGVCLSFQRTQDGKFEEKSEVLGDSGKVLVPAEWLENVRIGEDFTINLGRGNGRVLEVKSKEYYLFASSIAQSLFVMEE